MSLSTLEEFKVPEGSVEAGFLSTVDKIMNGKILAVWKES